jgi:hypothetical protein
VQEDNAAVLRSVSLGDEHTRKIVTSHTDHRSVSNASNIVCVVLESSSPPEIGEPRLAMGRHVNDDGRCGKLVHEGLDFQ